MVSERRCAASLVITAPEDRGPQNFLRRQQRKGLQFTVHTSIAAGNRKGFELDCFMNAGGLALEEEDELILPAPCSQAPAA